MKHSVSPGKPGIVGARVVGVAGVEVAAEHMSHSTKGAIRKGREVSKGSFTLRGQVVSHHGVSAGETSD